MKPPYERCKTRTDSARDPHRSKNRPLAPSKSWPLSAGTPLASPAAAFCFSLRNTFAKIWRNAKSHRELPPQPEKRPLRNTTQQRRDAATPASRKAAKRRLLRIRAASQITQPVTRVRGRRRFAPTSPVPPPAAASTRAVRDQVCGGRPNREHPSPPTPSASQPDRPFFRRLQRKTPLATGIRVARGSGAWRNCVGTGDPPNFPCGSVLSH